jgi:hypothetical protein
VIARRPCSTRRGYDRCFLPDLTGLVTLRRTGPSYHYCPPLTLKARMGIRDYVPAHGEAMLRTREALAEREGFEPSVRLLGVHTISSRAPSANSGISPCPLPPLFQSP